MVDHESVMYVYLACYNRIPFVNNIGPCWQMSRNCGSLHDFSGQLRLWKNRRLFSKSFYIWSIRKNKRVSIKFGMILSFRRAARIELSLSSHVGHRPTKPMFTITHNNKNKNYPKKWWHARWYSTCTVNPLRDHLLPHFMCPSSLPFWKQEETRKTRPII